MVEPSRSAAGLSGQLTSLGDSCIRPPMREPLSSAEPGIRNPWGQFALRVCDGDVERYWAKAFADGWCYGRTPAELFAARIQRLAVAA